MECDCERSCGNEALTVASIIRGVPSCSLIIRHAVRVASIPSYQQIPLIGAKSLL